VELLQKARSNPWLGAAAIAAALLLIAWIAWAIYVTSDRGANAGLGVVLSWPVLLGALALVAALLAGPYLLIRLLSPGDEADVASSISGGSADAEAEADEEDAAADEGEDDAEDEDSADEEEEAEDDEGDEEDMDEGDEGDEEEEEVEPEETDPDEEPSSREKASD
jgi:hypothetical protein